MYWNGPWDDGIKAASTKCAIHQWSILMKALSICGSMDEYKHMNTDTDNAIRYQQYVPVWNLPL
jgi:hypothetical protein